MWLLKIFLILFSLITYTYILFKRFIVSYIISWPVVSVMLLHIPPGFFITLEPPVFHLIRAINIKLCTWSYSSMRKFINFFIWCHSILLVDHIFLIILIQYLVISSNNVIRVQLLSFFNRLFNILPLLSYFSELFGGPQIYFNHRCFSGPYLSKGRIAELPRCVGPGPVTLVMKEVLSMLINTAYKSCRVLRELQLDGRPNPNLTQQLLKAK